MFNPDGSEFERSGNGLRIFGSYLYAEGRVELREPFSVEVGGETVEMEILGEEEWGILNVAVEMGRARFGARAIGAEPESFGPESTLEGPWGGILAVHLVSMGNPHCVVLREDLREGELEEFGPFLSSHDAFPQGTNVQLAKVSGEGSVDILIWERGVGRTSSSGTSASAVAAACVGAGLLRPGPIQVRMEGGSFVVTVSPEMAVRLEGPVQPLFRGDLESGLVGSLR
jgi:diaminopimelate epimerase